MVEAEQVLIQFILGVCFTLQLDTPVGRGAVCGHSLGPENMPETKKTLAMMILSTNRKGVRLIDHKKQRRWGVGE